MDEFKASFSGNNGLQKLKLHKKYLKSFKQLKIGLIYLFSVNLKPQFYLCSRNNFGCPMQQKDVTCRLNTTKKWRKVSQVNELWEDKRRCPGSDFCACAPNLLQPDECTLSEQHIKALFITRTSKIMIYEQQTQEYQTCHHLTKARQEYLQ